VLPKGRIVAAALAGAVTTGVFLAAGAGGGSAPTTVTLQIAPRGLGTVTASPPGLNSDNMPVSECDQNFAQHACEWRYTRGTNVMLTAKPDTAAGRSLTRWSTADCPGTGNCSVVLDDDLTSIVALFTPLRLAVRLSQGGVGSAVSTNPIGAPCRGSLHDPTPDFCREFPPLTRVTLTVQPEAPHTFKEWSSGCRPVARGSCAITVLDEATWVGASFDDDKLPVLPTTIRVQFRLRKAGHGSGRITGSGLDCGTDCGARYDYGTSLTLTAAAGRGSVFDGWKDRVCAPTKTRCAIPVGPITAMGARFARPPSAPASLKVTLRTRTSITVFWPKSKKGDARVTGYRVYLNGAVKARTSKRTFKLRKLKCGRRYRIAVAAVDAREHHSPRRPRKARTVTCPRR
jgi:Fibronectin type III domain/Divergent InlB B-repeat domain